MNIKLKLLLLFLLLPLLTGCGYHVLTTKQNDEINPDLRKQMSDNAPLLFDALKRADWDIIKGISSQELLAQNQINSDFLLKIQPVFKDSNFVLFDEYYTTVFQIGNDKVFTIIPSLKAGNSLIVNNITIPENSTYLEFWKSAGKDAQRLVFLQFIKNGSAWRLAAIETGAYSVQGMNAPDLVKKSDDLLAEKKYLSSAVYAIAARALMRPAPDLQYQDEQSYLQQIGDNLKTANVNYKFPITLDDKNKTVVVGVNAALYDDGGIWPTVNYLTSVTMDQNSKIQKPISDEAQNILSAVYEKFPELKESFANIILQAYNEAPTDPTKTYYHYNTPFKNSQIVPTK
jgi:hypothetical protein